MRWRWVIRRGVGRPFVVVVLLGGVIILIAGAGFAAVESDTVTSYWEGVWWALSLATTAGYVGETPVTTGGRILSGAVMLCGFWLITLTTAAIASLLVKEEEEPTQDTEIALEVEIISRLDELAARLDRLEQHLTRDARDAD